jgi:uncharacterized protein YcbX
MIVGRIAQIWRHPVKSMQGERLGVAHVGKLGIPGDRGWAVRDEVRGGIRGGKKIPALMNCAARYLDEPGEDAAQLPAPEITLPNGETLRANAPDAAERLSRALDWQITLWPLQPASDLDHYRRGKPDSDDVPTELRAMFGREENEPLPDFSVMPTELFEFESPPGTYFDLAPLLLVTDTTLRSLQRVAPQSRVDVRRFRPNFVVEMQGDAGEPFPEIAWAGKRLRIGGATIAATIACPRCVMITHAFADLPKDPGLMRAVVRDANQQVGVYANVAATGAVRVGDVVEIDG